MIMQHVRGNERKKQELLSWLTVTNARVHVTHDKHVTNTWVVSLLRTELKQTCDTLQQQENKHLQKSGYSTNVYNLT